MLSGEGIKKQLYSHLAKEAKENGIKKILITIKDDGNFDTDFMENKDVYNTETHVVISRAAMDEIRKKISA
jgi:hypothetical protein